MSNIFTSSISANKLPYFSYSVVHFFITILPFRMSEILAEGKNDVNAVKYISGRVYYGSSDKKVRASAAEDHKAFSELYSHDQQVTALASLEKKVVSAGIDGFVRFEDGRKFKSQMPVIRCMAVNKNEDRIALGGPDGAISIHFTDGRLENHWEGHSEVRP